MTTVLYMDMFLLINFLINYFLLLAARRLSGARAGRWRMAGGAAAGALMALVILLPPMPLWAQLGYKALSGAAVVLLAYSWVGARQAVKSALWFLACSFLLAGILLLAMTGLSFSYVTVNNLAFYLDISPLLLFGCMLITYSLVYLLTVLFAPPVEGKNVQVRLGVKGTALSFSALYDTGFRLEDPLSWRPVVLADWAACRNALPADMRTAAEGFFAGRAVGQESRRAGLRVLPFSTAAGQGLAPAFSADWAIVEMDGLRREVEMPLLALSPRPLEAGVTALMGPSFIGRETAHAGKGVTSL